MRINLLHNKIVMDTVSDKFIESFNKNLVPKLEEQYPNVDEVILYEDYLSDGFKFNELFYCPLTLVEGSDTSYVFVSWRINPVDFEGLVPYSYIGEELIEFDICEPPMGFRERLEGREVYLAAPHIAFTIEANFGDKTFLSGKYSESFVDLLAETLSHEIEREFSISGAEDSTLECRLVFSRTSFMEHVVDNVTYRRLLLSARSCAPRDLWVKWTRLDGCGSYTISDSVSPSGILFEIPDEVPEKIREKEYRYLINSASLSAYKNAMSRKNFTEWRELVKRVIKRGEVIKLEESLEISLPAENSTTTVSTQTEESAANDRPFAFDTLSLNLDSVLDSFSDVPETEESEEEEINPDIKELLRGLLSSVDTADTGPSEEPEEEPAEEFAEEPNEDTAEQSLSDVQDDSLPPFELDISQESAGVELDELVNTENEEETEESPLNTMYENEQEEPQPEAVPNSLSSIQKLLSDFDYDNRRAETENALKREIEALKIENNKLQKELDDKERQNELLLFKIEAYEEHEAEVVKELAQLREAMEAKRRLEEREKDRLAEAARQAVEEQKRAAADVDLAAEEEKKAALLAEEERYRREREEAERLREEESQRQREEALRAASIPEPQASRPAPVNYVSKTADLIFRSPVDPNITKRIQEIVVTTVKYFDKEDVYMKIKASIPEPNMVRLAFLKIPDNESELLTDIIRVLGHSKLGITKVLLN